MKLLQCVLVAAFLLGASTTLAGECQNAGGEEAWLDDDCCDAANNIEACNWDNGACCSSTCNDYDDLDDGNYTCGDETQYCEGFTQCSDPGASGNGYCDESLNNFEKRI